jgi:hypothetical protein
MKVVKDHIANADTDMAPVHGDRRRSGRQALADDEASLATTAKLDDLSTSSDILHGLLDRFNTFLTLQVAESVSSVGGRLLSRILRGTACSRIRHARTPPPDIRTYWPMAPATASVTTGPVVAVTAASSPLA